MAWAMDACNLTTEFFTPALDRADYNLGTESTDVIFYEHNLVDDSGNNCNTLCTGWAHLNYISYKVLVVNAIKTHSDVASGSLIYYFTLPVFKNQVHRQ